MVPVSQHHHHHHGPRLPSQKPTTEVHRKVVVVACDEASREHLATYMETDGCAGYGSHGLYACIRRVRPPPHSTVMHVSLWKARNDVRYANLYMREAAALVVLSSTDAKDSAEERVRVWEPICNATARLVVHRVESADELASAMNAMFDSIV